jgi:hypothetical protein
MLLWKDITRQWRNRSVSFGTDADVDLIPRLANALGDIARECWRAPDASEYLAPSERHEAHSRISKILTLANDDQVRYFGTTQAHQDKLWLIKQLNFYAPVGYTFRTDPGDGSNYGFWGKDTH